MNLASLAEKNLADYGEYERLLFEGKSFTNRQLHDSSCRLAQALVDLGCQPGDKVVLMMPNGPEVFITYPAIWRAGLTVIPVLFVLEAREVAFIVENSRAKVVVTSPDVYPERSRKPCAVGAESASSSPEAAPRRRDARRSRTSSRRARRFLSSFLPPAPTSLRFSTRAVRRAGRRASSRRTKISTRTR